MIYALSMLLCFCVVLAIQLFVEPFKPPIVKNKGHFEIPVKNSESGVKANGWMYEWIDLHQLVS